MPVTSKIRRQGADVTAVQIQQAIAATNTRRAQLVRLKYQVITLSRQLKRLMNDPDYLRTLASVYTAVGRDAEAQRVLQVALDLPFPSNTRGVKADAQLQYAGLLLAAKRYEQASGLYRQVLAADTTNTEAWQGLIQTEHAVGQDTNALQALGAMPPQNYRQWR